MLFVNFCKVIDCFYLTEGFLCGRLSVLRKSFFCAKNYPVRILQRKARDKMRSKITLACVDCKQRNYNTTKEKKNHPDRMETKKFCRFCNKHTLHRETK